MLRTGKPHSEGQSFHRKLLSEYDTNITLENYMSYFELKGIAKKAEKLRIELEERLRENKIAAVSGCSGREALLLKEKPIRSNSTIVEDMFTPNAQEEATKLFPNDDTIAAIYSKLGMVQKTFFHILHVSYLRVKKYLLEMEERLIKSMDVLRHYSDTVLREISPDYIPSLYAQVQAIVCYRTLNLYAFRKIMRKFLERCACDSILLQRRVFVLDAIIDESSVAHPTVDLRGVALELIALYGTVFKYSYEETLKKLQYYDYRTRARDPRLLPTSDTFFFANTLPHQEMPGSFMVRVIAGSGSTFAEKMLTEVLQCPRQSTAVCQRYPNGEILVKLLRAVRGDDVFVVQSMVASPREDFSTSDAIVELALLIQCVKLAGATRVTAVVPYLAYTRNVASIAVLAEVIETMGCNHVVTVDMHSDQVEGMFTIPLENVSAKFELIRYLSKCLQNEGHDFSNITIVAPSGDYLGRAKDFADALMRFNHLDADKQFVSVCTAAKRFRPSAVNHSSSYTTMNNNNNNNHRYNNNTNSSTATAHRNSAQSDHDDGNAKNTTEASRHTADTATTSIAPSRSAAGAQDVEAEAEAEAETEAAPVGGEGADKTQAGAAAPSSSSGQGGHSTSELAPVNLSNELNRAMRHTQNSEEEPSTHRTSHVDTGSSASVPRAKLDSSYLLDTHLAPRTPTHRAHKNGSSSSSSSSSTRSEGLLRQPSLQTHDASHHSPTSGSDLGSPLTMASKTLGMEKALRKQAAGRGALLQQVIPTEEDEINDIVIVGDAHNRLCIILETMIGEAENLSAVVRALRAHGAQRIFLVSTHAVLCGRSRERLIDLPIELIIVTDTVNMDHEMYDPRLARKLRVVPIAPLLALTIEKIHTENTLSTLFEK